ncbi:hypothetical protein ACOTXT_21645, partial [Enterobacter cloacae complex sp. IR5422]
WRRLLENSLSAKVSCWLIRLLILGSGYNTMISHLGLIRTFLKALIRKDPHAAKLAMWQHLENTKQMLFNETSDDFEFNADRYLFADNPVVHLDTVPSAAK